MTKKMLVPLREALRTFRRGTLEDAFGDKDYVAGS